MLTLYLQVSAFILTVISSTHGKLVTKVGAVVPNDDSDLDDLSAPHSVPHGSVVDSEIENQRKAQLKCILMLTIAVVLLVFLVYCCWYKNSASIEKVAEWNNETSIRRDSILPKRVIALERELEERQRLRQSKSSRNISYDKHGPNNNKKRT
eukprot:SAG31_NODE_86_length_26973_cov_16.850897_15_plen_152_part_00